MKRIPRTRSRTRTAPPGRFSLDVFIRVPALISDLVVLCYDIFSPFVSLDGVGADPRRDRSIRLQQMLDQPPGRQELAWRRRLLVLGGIVLIVAPDDGADRWRWATRSMTSSTSVQRSQPADSANLRPALPSWPVVGEKVHATVVAGAHRPAGDSIHEPAAVARRRCPRRRSALPPRIGGSVLLFLVVLHHRRDHHGLRASRARRQSQAIFERIVGTERGERIRQAVHARPSAPSRRASSAWRFIQAIVVGLCLLVAGIPWAGVLAVIVLVLGIAQVPALLVTLPAIVYIWSSRRLRHRRGDHLHRAARRSPA